MREANLPEEIQPEQDSDHDPEREEDLTVKDTPAVCQVSDGEELQRQSQLDECEDDLHGVHPPTTLRHRLQEVGEDSEEREGQGQRKCEAEHPDSRSEHPRGRGSSLYEERTDDRPGAREGNQREREGHKEDADEARSRVCLSVHLRGPRGGQDELKRPEERDREDDEEDKEGDVEDSVRSQIIQGIRAEDRRDDEPQ